MTFATFGNVRSQKCMPGRLFAVAALAAIHVAVQAVAAQTPDKPPAFEVASIKPAAPNQPGMGMQRLPGGRINMKNVTLRVLISLAWDIRDFQITGGPAWIDSDRFDILAKPETEIPDNPEGRVRLLQMIRTLAADRFGLVCHRETKETNVYALVVAKNGLKLAAPTPQGHASMMGGRGKLEGKDAKPADLARLLSTILGRTVLDKTELSGEYDFNLQWTPDIGDGLAFKGAPPESPRAADGPSIFTAIQEQLGLKLESQKGPVEMLVVDRAEKPAEN